MLLVYGGRKHKLVPRPSFPDPDIVRKVRSGFNQVFTEISGEFIETDEAREYSAGLYDFALGMNDPRFDSYHERLYTHLINIAIDLYVVRDYTCIYKAVYNESHRILSALERTDKTRARQAG